MLFDAVLPPLRLDRVPDFTRAAEQVGFDGVWTHETIHDPFLPCALLAEHSRQMEFGTAIAVSFARSPADIAYTAWDLADASSGRFILGLGTQVKAHITRRFGMDWPQSPVTKFREQLAAIRALWRAWQGEGELDFHGDYYHLDLMTPFFNPGPIPNPEIPIFTAGVNIGMARLAGESADGFHVHPFHTPGYIKEVLLPVIEDGAGEGGRSMGDVDISVTVFAATTDEEKFSLREQIAFYASTPSYRGVMAHHGWEGTASELSRLASKGRWEVMSGLISEEMLETFVTFAEPDRLGRVLRSRYRGIADRINLYTPFQPGKDQEMWRQWILDLKGRE